MKFSSNFKEIFAPSKFRKIFYQGRQLRVLGERPAFSGKDIYKIMIIIIIIEFV